VTTTPETDPDPAPALTRGLWVLGYLNREGACSLDRLAKSSTWPKASVLRLLRSLETAGAVARDPASKRWHALKRLAGGGGPEEKIRLRCAEPMAWLCRACGQTVEVYAWDQGRLRMVDRAEPEDVEVTVRARIGSLWGWDVDSLALVGYAFGIAGRDAQAPWPARELWCWRDRVRVAFPAAELPGVVAEVKSRTVASDLGSNGNGVWRHSAPLRDGNGGLVGAIAVARVDPPGGPDRRPEAHAQLTEAVERMGVFAAS
jgi:DNA-binding IclR family transcriptional regulator